jgi:hypothetical protein
MSVNDKAPDLSAWSLAASLNFRPTRESATIPSWVGLRQHIARCLHTATTISRSPVGISRSGLIGVAASNRRALWHDSRGIGLNGERSPSRWGLC